MTNEEGATEVDKLRRSDGDYLPKCAKNVF